MVRDFNPLLSPHGPAASQNSCSWLSPLGREAQGKPWWLPSPGCSLALAAGNSKVSPFSILFTEASLDTFDRKNPLARRFWRLLLAGSPFPGCFPLLPPLWLLTSDSWSPEVLNAALPDLPSPAPPLRSFHLLSLLPLHPESISHSFVSEDPFGKVRMHFDLFSPSFLPLSLRRGNYVPGTALRVLRLGELLKLVQSTASKDLQSKGCWRAHLKILQKLFNYYYS